MRKVRLAVCPVVASHPAPLSPMPPQSPALSPPDMAQLSIGKNLSPLTYTEIGLNEPLSGVLLELLNQAPDPWTNYQSTSHSATKGGFITQREIRKSWASIFRLSLVVIFPGKCWLTYRAFRCIHFSTQVVQLSRFPIKKSRVSVLQLLRIKMDFMNMKTYGQVRRGHRFLPHPCSAMPPSLYFLCYVSLFGDALKIKSAVGVTVSNPQPLSNSKELWLLDWGSWPLKSRWLILLSCGDLRISPFVFTELLASIFIVWTHDWQNDRLTNKISD